MISVIGVIGCTGRMGQAITSVIEGHPSACIAGGLTSTHSVPDNQDEQKHLITDNPEELFPKSDVLIDFSHSSVTATYAKLAEKHKKPYMVGTTGISEEAFDVLKEVSKTIPVLYASNTSLSLVVTKKIAQIAAFYLRDHDYDISILDKHHKWKQDAPSGTALTLGEAITEGNEGKHEPTYAAIRSGSIIGEHDILFAGQGENITIQHRVTDRRVFARGAVEAALWLAKQPAGYYTMDAVLSVEE